MAESSIAVVLLLLVLVGCQSPDPLPHLVHGYPAWAGEGLVHVVVEIPAGTNAKWEVDKREGVLRREVREGRPRVVRYLGYPANYGMVPRTLLPKERGGDGDPLDVLLLGTAQPRGTVARARLLGVLRLTDGGEQDDKLIAVLPSSPFGEVRDLAQLDARFPGVTAILETWMTHYKGPGVVVSRGFGDVAAAETILAAAMSAYATRWPETTSPATGTTGSRDPPAVDGLHGASRPTGKPCPPVAHARASGTSPSASSTCQRVLASELGDTTRPLRRNQSSKRGGSERSSASCTAR